MRAFLIVLLGFAGVVALTGIASAKSASVGHISEQEVKAGCASVKGDFQSDEHGYSCIQSLDGHPIVLTCSINGNCMVFYNTVKPNNMRGLAGLSGNKVMQGSGPGNKMNTGITTGAAQGLIAVSPLKPVGSNAATASTTMSVSASKQAGSNAAAAASPNLGAASMSSGRATLRQP